MAPFQLSGHKNEKTSKVLIVGGQFSGLFTARDLRKHFYVTIVDAKEFFEYTPGILRCYVKPAHFDSLSFTLQPVIERSMGVKFIWGEVLKIDGEQKCAEVLPIYSQGQGTKRTDIVSFDYCCICAGCDFNPFKPSGESLWFPTVRVQSRAESEWGHIDERYIEGRRRHILEEYHSIAEYAKKNSTMMIAGAGFIGVEWATELEHFFPSLQMTIIDFLPRCLGPLPDGAAMYCSEYMAAVGIKEFYGIKYEPKNDEFWAKCEYEKDGDGKQKQADKTYVCMGVKASNHYLSKELLSDKGPGGGGWIHVNKKLQVTKKPKKIGLGEEPEGELWADGCIYAVGDCNYGCIGSPPKYKAVVGGKEYNVAFAYGKHNSVDEAYKKPNEVFSFIDIPNESAPEGTKGFKFFMDASGNLKAEKEGDATSFTLLNQKVEIKKLENTGWVMPPCAKISYPGEEQALHACNNIEIMDHNKKHGSSKPLQDTWWPWGAGMFATSLGPHDACFVVAANEISGSGYMVNWWLPAAIQKEIIETTKVNECKNGWIGVCIWHFVHHTPVNLFGRGPFRPRSKAFGFNGF